MILARLFFAVLAGVWASFAVVAEDAYISAGFTVLTAVCGLTALYCREDD